MRVLIVSVFPPDPAPEANHALHISEYLEKSGFDVHVLCGKGSISATRRGIVVHPVMEDWTWSSLPKLTQCLRESRPDVVFLLYLGWVYRFQPMITFLPTICKSVLPGVPCVTQFEAIDTSPRPQSIWSECLRKGMELWAGHKNVHRWYGTLLRDSACVIALSSPHRDRLVHEYEDVQEKCFVIPPPPLIRFCSEEPSTVRSQTRTAIGASESDFVLIYWGFIYPGKGVETLLQAFDIVFRQDSNVRLVLVGGSLEVSMSASSSDYFRMVQQLTERLSIAERITWTGQFQWDSDTGSRYLHAGDACVLPFDFGVTLNNSSLAAASTHGLPVIGTELPEGHDEALQHGRNIYLCQPRDPEMLAEAILSLKENALMRERLRTGAIRLAQDWYQPSIVARRLLEVLNAANASRHGLAHKEERSADSVLREVDGVHGENLRLSPFVWAERELDDDTSGPLLSVIVAVYNVERYLSHCLDSLVHQTLQDIEIIAVNDASTDSSLDILQEYQARYPRLRVLTCAYNKGLATVRNIGLRAARGRYVGFLDGDDWADIRMGEVMVRRASRDDADVAIADVTVSDEESKGFGPFGDYYLRAHLPRGLRTAPFHVSREPRILLLEPVAWPKIYKRSFLWKHDIHFEAGMNSYEDMCFHFSVLLKATRISLMDDALFFYRRNRPGQISGRTDRRIFEVFAVFERIHQNLTAWDVPADIWAMLVKVQMRQFDWLLRDRVQPEHKREFFARVKEQFRVIPSSAFEISMKHDGVRDQARLLCMRRNWLQTYETLAAQSWPLSPRLYLGLYRQRSAAGRPVQLKRAYVRLRGMVRQNASASLRSLIKRVRTWAASGEKLESTREGVTPPKVLQRIMSSNEEPVVQGWQINNQVLILSCPSAAGLSAAVSRVTNDHYLSSMAVFREGDTLVDIGAHVGVMSIYLAKTYPFIKVFAIEPDPFNYACLIRNLEVNGVTNVTPINTAVSGDGGKKTLYVDASDSTWATTDANLACSRGSLRVEEVVSVTLEALFDKLEIRHCRLLKITAPGSVLDILKQFKGRDCIDLLCGEADSEDGSRAKLEVVGWSIARQHFLWIHDRQAAADAVPWIRQLPTGCEDPRAESKPRQPVPLRTHLASGASQSLEREAG
jgi:FkbM family methyltransferase